MTYSRRILLIAMGTTPHLLTVTLSALYKKDPHAMPTEIHVLTTRMGAESVRQAFLGGKDDPLARFHADYGLPPVGLEERNIHVITDGTGSTLDDIRTPDDGTNAADFIVELVRELCSDPDASLTVSIVGGRKSMGLLLGSAMMFFGRDQDTVSHVLSRTETPAGTDAWPVPAELRKDSDLVELGEIPFLRLRPILPPVLLGRRYGYSEIVAASQARLSGRVTASVRQERGRWRLFVDDVEVKPEKRCLGLYVWLALRRKLGRPTMTSPAGMPLERFLLLRLQFVMVLEQVLGEASWRGACVQYLGLDAGRLHDLMRQAQAAEIADDLSFFRWMQAQLDEPERRAFSDAAFAFPKKISICRTRFNEKLAETLGETIPDVTRRRLTHALIASNGDRDGATYAVDLQPADISLPPELRLLLAGEAAHPALHWKTV